MRGINVAAVLALFFLGCTITRPGITCTDGHEACPCVDGTRCLSGLTCVSGTCIDPTRPPDGGTTGDGSVIAPFVPPNPEAFWAEDPPIQYCYMDGTMSPLPPVPMTQDELNEAECPPDRNREGCRCLNVGERAPCWPGLTRNRDRGRCQDGETTCQPYDEFTGRWGPCVGAILPDPNATHGAATCECFSAGNWDIDNLTPCAICANAECSSYLWALSDDPATGDCYPGAGAPAEPPTSSPWPYWSANRLTIDCEGRFDLCLTLYAGPKPDSLDTASPSTNCVLGRSCVNDQWYGTRNVVQELDFLPSWVSSDTECVNRFFQEGGYGEMTVRGTSVECNEIDDGSGGIYIFKRYNYCPLACMEATIPPDLVATCENCRDGGMSGDF